MPKKTERYSVAIKYTFERKAFWNTWDKFRKTDQIMGNEMSDITRCMVLMAHWLILLGKRRFSFDVFKCLIWEQTSVP